MSSKFFCDSCGREMSRGGGKLEIKYGHIEVTAFATYDKSTCGDVCRDCVVEAINKGKARSYQ